MIAVMEFLMIPEAEIWAEEFDRRCGKQSSLTT
jgi:hypothetical protein